METLELQEIVTSKNVLFKNILLATDFSEVSLRALRYAAAIATAYRCQLYLAHVVPPEPKWPIPIEAEPPELRNDWSDAELAMQALVSEVFVKSTPHEVLLERGPIQDVLLDLMRRHDIGPRRFAVAQRRGTAGEPAALVKRETEPMIFSPNR